MILKAWFSNEIVKNAIDSVLTNLALYVFPGSTDQRLYTGVSLQSLPSVMLAQGYRPNPASKFDSDRGRMSSI
jgi:hypothetical protein